MFTPLPPTTDASPDLGKLAEIQSDASVQTMPLHFGWSCRTFQTASMSMSLINEVFECLLRLWMGIWLHTHTVTTTDLSPDLGKLAEILPNASVQTVPLHFDGGCRTFQTASHVNDLHIWGFEYLLRIWMGIWLSTHINTKTQMLPPICESWVKSYHALVEAVKPFKLHPMSTTYIYEVFERLLRLWMGIWLHTNSITTTDTSPDLEGLAEILPIANVQTMPLCFDWGFRTYQTASHVHVIHIWCVWAPSQVVDGHMTSHSHHNYSRHLPRFVRAGWYTTWCKCAIHATTLWLRL